MSSDVISTREAAKLLGVSVRSIQLWVESGVLKAWKTAGNHRRIYKDSVNSLIQQRQTLNPLILIVEDEATVQAYIQALIESFIDEPNIVFANNGFEGLIKLGEMDPSLLLIDLDMPEMNGIEMIRSLRSIEKYKSLHASVITGLSSKEIEKRGGIPEDITCYKKPLNKDSLIKIFEQANIKF